VTYAYICHTLSPAKHPTRLGAQSFFITAAQLQLDARQIGCEQTNINIPQYPTVKQSIEYRFTARSEISFDKKTATHDNRPPNLARWHHTASVPLNKNKSSLQYRTGTINNASNVHATSDGRIFKGRGKRPQNWKSQNAPNHILNFTHLLLRLCSLH